MTKTNAVKIHHATLASAEKNGVELKIVKEGFQAIHESGKKAKAASAKEALAKVLTLVKDNNENEEGDEEGSAKEIVKPKYKKLYAEHGGNCGDDLAKTLTTYRRNASNPEKAFLTVCRDNKIEPSRWEGHNQGLQWMALSNVLRNRVRKGEVVNVDGVQVNKL